MFLKSGNEQTELVHQIIYSNNDLLESICDFAEQTKNFPDRDELILNEVKTYFTNKFSSGNDPITITIGESFLSKVDWKKFLKIAKGYRNFEKHIKENETIFLTAKRNDDYYSTSYCSNDGALEIDSSHIVSFSESLKDKTVHAVNQSSASICFKDGTYINYQFSYAGENNNVIRSFDTFYIQDNDKKKKVYHCFYGPAQISRMDKNYEFKFMIHGNFLDKKDSRKCTRLFLNGEINTLTEFMKTVQLKYSLETSEKRKFWNTSFRCMGHKIMCHE